MGPAHLHVVDTDGGTRRTFAVKGACWEYLQQLVANAEPSAHSMQYNIRFGYMQSNSEDYEGTIVYVANVLRLSHANWNRLASRYDLDE